MPMSTGQFKDLKTGEVVLDTHCYIYIDKY